MEDKNKKTIDQNLRTIHTYEQDMADAVRTDEVSVIKIALAEKNKKDRAEVYKELQGTTTSKVFYVIGAIVLITLGSLGAYFVFKEKEKNNAPIPKVESTIKSFISYDYNTMLDVTDTVSVFEISRLLKIEMDKNIAPGTVNNIVFYKKQDTGDHFLNFKEFLSLVDTNLPEKLLRSLNDDYTLGTYRPKTESKTLPGKFERPHLFILFSSNDYSLSYSGMLDYERTMLSDMYTVFDLKIGDKNLFEKQFEDVIIDNKDARVLYDENENPLLYYMFVDRDKFIITDNVDTLKEVIVRLIQANKKPL